MQTDDVLAFLDQHPDFLAHHAERLGLKPGGAPQDRVVVSLAERQLLDLKDRNRQLESRLQQLVRHSEANDRIIANAHQLALSLQACRSLQDVLSALPACFAEHFKLERIALRLWHPAAESAGAVYDARNEVAALARNLSAPYCGPYVNDDVLAWFPATPVLQSFAQLALRDATGQTIGLLALASDDAQRFTFDMHTHYLAQIGEQVSVALIRVLEAQ
ncbi:MULTISPECIES: DUF484 family protein [Chromobacterium]|uniref:DUF484 family protein n=1 Tax=Chromobacterium aquaticum TaxID=467180 RepID=A0ABV8ZUS1_9NEIS|nr:MULTISPECIES: DUF484 family protein [Chromobacterium]KMN33109.1 hypothetical protein VI26_16140 [Chromobacterium sp. LK1]MCD5363632.1 DUF484 family protein [Chromobacterium aquaticum]